MSTNFKQTAVENYKEELLKYLRSNVNFHNYFKDSFALNGALNVIESYVPPRFVIDEEGNIIMGKYKGQAIQNLVFDEEMDNYFRYLYRQNKCPNLKQFMGIKY